METMTENRATEQIHTPPLEFSVYTGSKKEKRIYCGMKRLADVLCSLLALIVLAIPMLIIALIIYLDDPHGSPFFVQTRIGKEGQPFRFYKLRSMYVNAESDLDALLKKNEMDGPPFKIKNDPRITKVGRFIRKCSLDELPQLVNILRGEMSIVGPRPALPREVELYTDYQKQRLGVVPGLTCFWQVHEHRNSLSFDEWVELDLQYITQRSLWVDFKLVMKTFVAVFTMSGE